MKEPRKLSLQEEIEREVQQIEKELAEHPELDDVQVTEEMDRALLAKIRAYEEEKEEEEAARREIAEKNKKSRNSESSRNLEKDTDRNVEFSEELVPDLSVFVGNANDHKTAEHGNGLADDHVISGSGTEIPDDNKTTEDTESKKLVPYRRKKRRYLFVSLVAVLALVLGIGMTSVGSKSYLKSLWDSVLGKESLKYIDVEDMNIQETEDGDEITVYKEIGEKLGITAVRIRYRPKKMKLINYTIDEELLQARLFFQYEEQIIRYTMYVNDADSSWGEKEEDKKIDEYSIVVNDVEIQVEEYEVPEYSTNRQEAEFEYLGVQYQLKGIIEKEEFIKILEDLYFL